MNISYYHQRKDKEWQKRAEQNKDSVLIFTPEEVETLKTLLPIEIKRAENNLAPAKYVLRLKEIKDKLN